MVYIILIIVFIVVCSLLNYFVEKKRKKGTKIIIRNLGEFKNIKDISIFNDFYEVDDYLRAPERRDDEELLRSVGYTEKEILDFASKSFKEVAKAWSNFDYHTLRRYYSDEMFNKLFAKIENMKYNGYTHVFEDIKVVETRIYNVGASKNGVHAIVELVADMYDYILDNRNRIVSGSDKRKIRCEYRLTFTSYSMRNRSLDLEQNCKNCGAVLKPMQTKCSYCNTTIDMKKQDLVISNKARVRSKNHPISIG